MNFPAHPQPAPVLTDFCHLFDDSELFDYLSNEDVLELSRLAGRPGFSSLAAIRKSTGIDVRRILRPGITAFDLAMRLVEKACLAAELRISDFSRILLCHSGTSSEPARKLGDRLQSTLELPEDTLSVFNFGCTGFLKLLNQALSATRDSSNGPALLLSIETPESWHDATDRLFCGLVSAGAVGAILWPGSQAAYREGYLVHAVQTEDVVIPDKLRPNPDPMFRVDVDCEGFDFRRNRRRCDVMRMNAEPVFLAGIELMLAHQRAAMAELNSGSLPNGQVPERVIAVPHQPSGKLLRALMATARPEFPDVHFVNNLAGFGNTISATIPSALARLPALLQQDGIAPPDRNAAIILLAAGISMEHKTDRMAAGHAVLTPSFRTSARTDRPPAVTTVEHPS